jgi:hypothetical protein
MGKPEQALRTRMWTTSDWMVRFERGLGPRHLSWGEVRKGGSAPLRVV